MYRIQRSARSEKEGKIKRDRDKNLTKLIISRRLEFMMKVEIPRKKSNFSDIIFRTLPLVFVHITIDRATRETRKVGN